MYPRVDIPWIVGLFGTIVMLVVNWWMLSTWTMSMNQASDSAVAGGTVGACFQVGTVLILIWVITNTIRPPLERWLGEEDE